MSGWVAVTFYTAGTGYEREVERLKKSAAAFSVPLEVYAYPNRGSWRRNLNYKSDCILKALAEHPGQDVVFIDADAVVRSYPSLFDGLSSRKEYGLAAHFYERSGLYKGELLSGTLWVANTDAGRTVVERWHAFAVAHPELRHQRCLHMTLKGARVYGLPASYTRIYDARGMSGVVPVIEHFQASRRLKRGINLHGKLGKSPHTMLTSRGPLGCVR